MFKLTKEQKKQMADLMADYDARYDSELHMLGEACRSRGYHTNIRPGEWVHSVERSLKYAVALLDMGNASRAEDIIRAVLPLQDMDENSETFGIWPYFYEEPVSQMNPPDWNSADFCSKMLLQALIDYDAVLPKDLVREIEEAVLRSCVSICRRDAEIQYTNIALMDIYVTVLTGEYLNRTDLLDYGREKAERFWSYTKTMGALNEFNSPNYNLLVAKDVSLMLHQVKNDTVRKTMQEIYDFVWAGIAEHFSVSLTEWTAPNARRYEDFLTDGQLTDLETALGAEGRFTKNREADPFAFRCRMSCPEKYLSAFMHEEERSICRMNSRGFLYPYYAFAQVASTYMTKSFALGSFNRSELWNQIRPLQCFFGSGECKKSLRLRCLHDGYDFASGLLHAVQLKGQVLGTVNFSTDRGDTHINLDRLENGRFTARDLRISFSFTGDISNLKIEKGEDCVQINDGGINILIRVLEGAFADETVRCEIRRTEAELAFDIVFYSGEEREFCLCDMENAYCCFYTEISCGRISEYDAAVSHSGTRIKTEVRSNGHTLCLENYKRPYPLFVMTSQDIQCIDGKRIEDYAAGIDH